MQKFFSFFILGSIFINSCNSNTETKPVSEKKSEEITSIFPVTEFLKGQLSEIENSPVTILKTTTINGKTDSNWVNRENLGNFMTPFLNPVIDSISLSSYFVEKSFLDQTINAITLSYDLKANLPDSFSLQHWNVYIDPQKNKVQRIYLVRESIENGSDLTTQLTWTTGESCSIRKIIQKQGNDPEIKEEKMIWDFSK